LFWSEVASGIRQLEYRREVSAVEATDALTQLLDAKIEPYPSRDVARDAQKLARQLGWAKTYDAEFVTLARRLGVRLLTVDVHLAATAARFVEIYRPHA
jgi:predicted nucleic acid-binding protein